MEISREAEHSCVFQVSPWEGLDHTMLRGESRMSHPSHSAAAGGAAAPAEDACACVPALF